MRWAWLTRASRLGPGSGTFHRVQLGDDSLLVDVRYVTQLAAIDEALLSAWTALVVGGPAGSTVRTMTQSRSPSGRS